MLIQLRQSLATALSGLCCCALMAGNGAGDTFAARNSPQIPFTFVANSGQADADIRYIGLGPEFTAWFEDGSVVLQQGETAVRITFAGRPPSSGNHSTITADQPTGAHSNFLRGNNRHRWQTDLPMFGAIHYSGIWPGIELTYQADRGRLEAQYLVAPGAAVNAIQLRFDGDARIQDDETLRVRGASGDFIEQKPVFYQIVRGERVQVEGGFRKFPNGFVGFRVAKYDRSQPLLIDPSILFSGYFGGGSQDTITSVAIDAQNNTVVAGWTNSNNLPATNGARRKYAGATDAFVAAFFPNGGGLIYCTYLGGSGADRALGLALDSARNVYITGWTSSVNFPLASAFQKRLSGTRDAFVSKLNAAGNSLIYSTYLGGSAVDTGNAIAIDPASAAR